MNMNDIVIIGNGGLAKEIAEYIDNINDNIPDGIFLVLINNPSYIGNYIHKYKVLCLDKEIANWRGHLGLVIELIS